MDSAVNAMDLPLLECMSFVTTWRGKQIGSDHKSVTLRLRFRSTERTLTHEEVDGPVDDVVDMLRSSFEAQLRT